MSCRGSQDDTNRSCPNPRKGNDKTEHLTKPECRYLGSLNLQLRINNLLLDSLAVLSRALKLLQDAFSRSGVNLLIPLKHVRRWKRPLILGLHCNHLAFGPLLPLLLLPVGKAR